MQKVALITGANRGIGLEVCRQLAKKNITVILTGRDETKCREAQIATGSPGNQISYYVMDVCNEHSIVRTKHYIKDTFGRLDILVNNAGIYLDEGVSIFDLPLSTLQETLEVNLVGAFLVSQALVPLMQENNYGRVVNVSSGYGELHDMGGTTAAYRISKTGLNALTRVLAAETNDSIKVNSVCPGWVRTLMGGSGAPRSVAKGAETIVWLATLGKDGPNGGFFRDKKPVPW
ncbi:MAG: SDR family oxidoreductase [Spirochaetota bacterium]